MFDNILTHADTILTAVGAVVIAASLITSGTPTPDPNTALGKVYRAVELLALVFGKAKDRGPQG
ncbi:hypothetical protein Sp245p_28790 (plasmid) [Azospirillum baldaniorum]|uniref:Uncharacterized protein n=1 Tax=Azospirillum baldaniorum TaxID=1064539 RepID=A0A9P1JY15_9PROT|nr:hypothetical protein [Azospirillum baldaniorum]AWJ93820.1 hypothetical protein Sp245p_28790 [Azospirillum baldaniorum]TWA81643.1 hypothetical protein FBZ85_10217 [Azospirillum brasilense]CCD01976.1 conserved protein of unknown function [Azospirillum baldaniorum]